MEEIDENEPLSMQIEKCTEYIRELKQEMAQFLEAIQRYQEDYNNSKEKKAVLAQMQVTKLIKSVIKEEEDKEKQNEGESSQTMLLTMKNPNKFEVMLLFLNIVLNVMQIHNTVRTIL